jgi:DNA-binding NarL/FixJ family response regulator
MTAPERPSPTRGASSRHPDSTYLPLGTRLCITVARRVRVLIADDQPTVRANLRRMLREAGLDVVGEASTGEAAVAAATTCAPDVVLTDLSLPDMDGLEVARRIRLERGHIGVVVLIERAERDRVLEAFDAGASGYLLEEDRPAALVMGIRAAAATSSSSSNGTDAHADGPSRSLPETNLTTRETEVLELVAEGMSNKQIARRLGITEGTVKGHLGRVFREIGVRRRTQAVVWMQHRRPTRPGQLSE